MLPELRNPLLPINAAPCNTAIVFPSID